MGNNKIQGALDKALKGIDTKGMAKCFATLSENQVYMQENQVEFEAYLKTIIENQKKIMEKLEIE